MGQDEEYQRADLEPSEAGGDTPGTGRGLTVEKLPTGDWRSWARSNAADIESVEQHTQRDDTGIRYEVVVTLRSLHQHQVSVWSDRVNFGHTHQTVAGGYAFVQAAREQGFIAEWIATIARQTRPG